MKDLKIQDQALLRNNCMVPKIPVFRCLHFPSSYLPNKSHSFFLLLIVFGLPSFWILMCCHNIFNCCFIAFSFFFFMIMLLFCALLLLYWNILIYLSKVFWDRKAKDRHLSSIIWDLHMEHNWVQSSSKLRWLEIGLPCCGVPFVEFYL